MSLSVLFLVMGSVNLKAPTLAGPAKLSSTLPALQIT
jgi:hypothetical protein